MGLQYSVYLTVSTGVYASLPSAFCVYGTVSLIHVHRCLSMLPSAYCIYGTVSTICVFICFCYQLKCRHENWTSTVNWAHSPTVSKFEYCSLESVVALVSPWAHSLDCQQVRTLQSRVSCCVSVTVSTFTWLSTSSNTAVSRVNCCVRNRLASRMSCTDTIGWKTLLFQVIKW